MGTKYQPISGAVGAAHLVVCLDDTKTAQKYEGKNVKVTGPMDASNNTIHVQKIEAA